MKRLIITLITAIAILTTSCEDKHNHLGDLNGNWQLTSWSNSDDETVIVDKTSGIYYSISISLLKIHSTNEHGKYYIATFRHTSDSLILTKAYASPFDSIVDYKDMDKYGVPSNGAFRIVELNNKHLTLHGGNSILSFRKN